MVTVKRVKFVEYWRGQVRGNGEYCAGQGDWELDVMISDVDKVKKKLRCPLAKTGGHRKEIRCPRSGGTMAV